MNPVTSWKKMIGRPVWLQSMMKRAALSALSVINHAAHLDAFLFRAHLLALAGDDADRASADARVGGDERFAVVGFVFIERIGVDDRREEIARIVGLVAIEADDVVNGLGRFGGFEFLRLRRVFRGFGFGQERD